MLAMIITSLVRGHLNRILWRAIHLLAYLCWPVAFAHSIGSSRDLQHGWLLDLAIACALVVAAAAGWRLASAARQLPRAARVAASWPSTAPHGLHEVGRPTRGSHDDDGPGERNGERDGERDGATASEATGGAVRPSASGCPACCPWSPGCRKTCAWTWPGTAARRTRAVPGT